MILYNKTMVKSHETIYMSDVSTRKQQEAMPYIFLCLSISSCALLSTASFLLSSSEYLPLLCILLPNLSRLGDLLFEYLQRLLGDLLRDLVLLFLSFSYKIKLEANPIVVEY